MLRKKLHKHDSRRGGGGGGELPPIHGPSGNVPLFGDGTQSRTKTFPVSFEQHPHIWGYLVSSFLRMLSPPKLFFAGPFCHIMFQQST